MIHQTAIIHSGAQVDNDVEIGPYSIIGDKVQIASGTKIGPHVVVNGPTKIGKDNEIFQFASIGEKPQDKKYKDEDTLLEIGNANIIREYCTFNRGTVQGGGITKIGDNNWIMAYVHIAHDCIVENNTIFANNASLAGHVLVEDFAILGGFALVHQFCIVGTHSFLAKATAVTKDVAPYLMVSGEPPKPHGLNMEGLKRNGFAQQTIKDLREAYRLLYRSGLTVKDAKKEMQNLPSSPELTRFMEFLDRSERGLVR